MCSTQSTDFVLFIVFRYGQPTKQQLGDSAVTYDHTDSDNTDTDIIIFTVHTSNTAPYHCAAQYMDILGEDQTKSKGLPL